MTQKSIPKSIPILYEDDDVLVINKPAGLVVHADGRTEEPTVVDWILTNRPDIKGVGDQIGDFTRSIVSGVSVGQVFKINGKAEADVSDSSNLSTLNLERSGIVHRLDRETSGTLLIAKNQRAFGYFKKQFQKQKIRKEYHAFVYGHVKHDEGMIDRPIARSRRNPVLWSATRGKRGAEREAITDYQTLTRRKDFTLLALFPRTGRTHQIRVHLKAINYPIVCDKLYAPNRPCELEFKRLALHARSLMFVSPTGKIVKVEAPYPKDFSKAQKVLEKSSS